MSGLHKTLLAVVIGATLPTAFARADAPKRPDVVVIVIDDLRWDELGASGHPFARTPNIDRVAAEGARFLNAFATTPLCSPSRASLLTGRYPHSHAIVDNTDRSKQSHALVTFPRLLHDAGYRTGFVGKWHMGNDPSRRPGFDSWACLKGQGTSFDPELDVDGSSVKEKGYVTDVLDGYATKFLKSAAASPQPFLLYVAEKGLHPETAQAADGTLSDPAASTYIPADRHKTLYADAPVPRRPNVRDSLEGKPALRREIAGLPPLSEATGTTDESIRDRQRMLASIDESVGRMMDVLRDAGRLDDALFIVVSDHGYFYGEHGLSVERRLAYEEAVRIPLFLRMPALVKPGVTIDRTVLTIDLAPTLLDLAGAAIPAEVQGVSFAPALRGQAMPPRDAFLIEHASDKVFPRVAGLGYKAVRTDRWKYIHYLELPDADELYDLQTDPYELTNRIADPAARPALDDLKAKLTALLPAEPLWVTIARTELGQLEVPGKEANNPRIVEYLATTKGDFKTDETAWCSAFANWVISRAGMKGTDSALARSWLKWGVPLDEPRPGCLVVFKRGNSDWQGHVGFYVGTQGDDILVLGGNQSNTVSIAPRTKADLLGYRWPSPAPKD